MTLAIDCSTCVRWVALGMVLAGPAGCDNGSDDGGGEPPACIELDEMTSCTPLYDPTYANVFAQTIQPRCGVSGSACHATADAMGAAGGFVVGDAASTHAALLDGGFVVPSDPSCSEVVVRAEIDDDVLRMPPGSSALPEGERCAVAQWIREGAMP